mgnify:CR=1 FL=1
MASNSDIQTDTLIGGFSKELAGTLLTKVENVTTSIPSQESEEITTFTDNNIPTLRPGTYTIKASQEITVPGEAKEKTSIIEKRIHIGGSRFGVSPDTIYATFPPSESAADYTTTFPHITFNRSSIPWEIRADKNRNIPWLALALFYEDEAPEVAEVELGSLKEITDYPSFQDKQQLLQVISIPNHLVPVASEWNCHVRHNSKPKDNQPEDTAWIIGNRLPKPGVKNIVHLISLADKLTNNKFISLYKWEFSCVAGKPNFTGLIKSMSIGPYCYRGSNFNRHFREGFVALPHFLRLGNKTLSLYQTPLLPYIPVTAYTGAMFKSTPPKKPAYGYERVEWIPLDDKSKIADVTYAAAFHLGQMLTVANKQVAGAIFKWKRQFYQALKKLHLEDETDKPVPKILQSEAKSSLPELASEWVSDFITLKKIPFNYLVPYEAMLPANSIRFFKLHKKWLKNCLDGVFSIGEEFFSFDSEEQLFKENYSGFIMRSPIISHYPEMMIKGYSMSGNKTELFFMRKLSSEVMICCFKDLISKIEISLPSGVMYMGLENASGFTDANGYVNLASLGEKMECKTPAELSVKLIRNSPKAIIS